jgi:DNA-binding MarR family transcriptional regulator
MAGRRGGKHRAPGAAASAPAAGAARPQDAALVLADRVHRAAIALLRRLRKTDSGMGLTPPQASALSVLVFGGPKTLLALAAAEGVTAPTMSRLVAAMERDGLATKTVDTADRRVVRVAPTARGRALLEAGRARRLQTLASDIRELSRHERAMLTQGTAILDRLNRAQPTR